MNQRPSGYEPDSRGPRLSVLVRLLITRRRLVSNCAVVPDQIAQLRDVLAGCDRAQSPDAVVRADVGTVASKVRWLS